MNQPRRALVTGCAGFIGYHLAERLLQQGWQVVGIDNLNDYYSVELKHDRLALLQQHDGFEFIKADISDPQLYSDTLAQQAFSTVFHLAAQAGVRYSLENPHAYVQSNLVGFVNILEWLRQHPPQHFIYASSSSVYGNNKQAPFTTDQKVDSPVSLYGATKKSNEVMAHSYSHLFNIPATGLRFFTVYGPLGRPDMAPIKFASRIMRGDKIDVYNHGNLARDFTYVDDIVEGMVRLIDKAPNTENGAPHRVFNIGRGQPVQLLDFIKCLEQALGREADKQYLPMQEGDVERTWADTKSLEQVTGFTPQVSLEQGIARFAEWFKRYQEKRTIA
ncbi:protein CapI [Idiomarina tyrosinivorans]|uniref:Protein CapI n=1 Tax=Idiomarina tyrosinivorans TaxID=1445662 RepID=A0A432ZPR6_9GAMM|nr:SDR family NAD(P)-dependent oxidoreductase [Idiomarina tyrosinivorans]RUO79899.1 protein CapI [Idiomarina tyrosinivorans]